MYRPPHLRFNSVQSPADGMTAGLTERISILSSAKIQPSDDIEFKSSRLVGGYNWIDNGNDEPVIAVPGLPDVWIGKDGKLGQLKSDNEIEGYMRYPDHHGARLIPHQLSRFEPIFHALDSPTDLGGVQLITDRNSLRKIYGLYTPDRMCGPKPFRIDAQKIGNVILLTRWEDPENRIGVMPERYCWSKSYHLATSRHRLQWGNSCHRILRYEFGGIEIMVRFELDSSVANATLDGYGDGSPDNTTTKNDDDLLPLPTATEIKAGITIHRTPYPSPPLSSFIEKKTRSTKGELDYVDIYGQFVFSQTPHLYVARHTSGYFSTLEKISLGQGKLRDIAKATEVMTGQAAGIIRAMMDCVGEFGECSFVWKGEGSNVEVWKGEEQVGLSEEAMEMLLAV